MLHRRARELRQHQTDAEALLWSKLRAHRLGGFKFRRQVPLGHYIADFLCCEARLIIELDGGQHNMPEGIEKDRERTMWLESRDFRVIRFWNHEVLGSLDAVLEVILRHLQSGPPVGS